MTKILQIIPTPPNLSDGIGDYASLLAKQLLKDHQITTHFLAFRTDIELTPVIDGFSATRLPAHHSQALLSTISEDIKAIVVHFSGYPYFKTNLKGTFGIDTPFWLIEALQSAIDSHHLKLIVMFHELPKLYWKQFYFFNYLNPIHSIVSRRLARLADAVITSSAGYQTILTKWLNQPVTRLSIFSNMGEPDFIPPLAERKRRMVIFGGSARYRVYKNAAKELIHCCKSLEIDEIYDIGPFLNLKKAFEFQDINLLELGFKSQEEISQIMLNSVAGCFDYTPFPGDLGKSGVLAAYCSHGLVPITTHYNPSEADGLQMNRHYLALKSWSDLNLSAMQTVANNAHSWYQSHNLKEIANTFASSIINNH